MRARGLTAWLPWCLAMLLAGGAAAAEGTWPARGPAIPLPEIAPGEVALRDWPEGRSLVNSARAWHYNRKLVQPLSDVGDAVEDDTLPLPLRRMLATIVAARNECRY